MDHQIYIKRCLELAAPHLGNVSPNPVVGALIIENNTIIGEGAHFEFGGHHAEVNAIQNVKDKKLLANSTLYVSLEPCCHHNKTPACTDLILKNKIKNVVVACNDPNPEVSGKGIEKLKNKGINVICGVLENEAKDLNKRFFTFHLQKRPYIILKWAQSNDGFIADDQGNSKWISNTVSRMLVHKWRREEASIMVGTKTAMVDNPALTVRDWSGKNPVKVVIDRTLKLNKNLKLFDSKSKLIVFNETIEKTEGHIHYIKLDFNSLLPEQMLYSLYKQEIISILIEGGSVLLNSFIQAGFWDEARVFTGYKVLNSGIKAPVLNSAEYSVTEVNGDVLRMFKKYEV